MAIAAPSPDIVLETSNGHPQTLNEWLTVFNLLVVVLDPFTYQSGWIIPTAARLFDHYEEADVRCAFVLTSDADGAKSFLGQYADQYLVLIDPKREFVRSLGLERLPALVHVDQNCAVAGAAQGWIGGEWAQVLYNLEEDMSWRTRPVIPAPGDPKQFEGTPALG